MLRHLGKMRFILIIPALLLCMGGVLFAGQLPKTLKVAAIFGAGVENAWTRAWIESFERVKAEKPFGVEMKLDYTENVYGDKALTVLEAYAESEEYGIIWFHSSATDEIESIRDDYPDTLFVVTGSGNRAIGGNHYLLYAHMHEPSYLLGVIAGSMTKSDVLGVVGLFPADDVNDQVHAFRNGARSVNSNTKMKVTFIESWYDPAKASEAANAQIAGADFILQLGESFETCKQKKIVCFGNYVDLNSVAPGVVMTSTVTKWDPQLNFVIKEWRDHFVDGKAYNAPMTKIWYPMSENGSDIAPFHNFEGKIPKAVKAKVEKIRSDIISGKYKVKLDMTMPKSD